MPIRISVLPSRGRSETEMLSDDWWFWALVALIVATAALGSVAIAPSRRAPGASALERRTRRPGPGRRIVDEPGRLLVRPLLDVAAARRLGARLAPGSGATTTSTGAVATDVVTGGAVIACTLAGIVFPPSGAQRGRRPVAGGRAVAGRLRQRGRAGRPERHDRRRADRGARVAALAAAAKRLAPGSGGPIGRVRPRSEIAVRWRAQRTQGPVSTGTARGAQGARDDSRRDAEAPRRPRVVAAKTVATTRPSSVDHRAARVARIGCRRAARSSAACTGPRRRRPG